MWGLSCHWWAPQSSFSLVLPCLEFGWTGGGGGWRVGGGGGGSLSVWQCMAGKTVQISSPVFWTMLLTFRSCLLLPTPVSNKTVKCISLQYRASSTNSSVSGDLTMIVLLIFRQCSIILVSASSWEEKFSSGYLDTVLSSSQVRRNTSSPTTYFRFLVCLCWGFTAQSTQWGHVERGQFT